MSRDDTTEDLLLASDSLKELEWQIRDIRVAAENALKALESINPACRDFRHLGDDRHRVGEECKPLTRYREITETLRKALGK